MDPHESEHGHDDPAAHLPDPSVWPLVIGFAALLFGFALVWWSRDRSNQYAGPVLGAALGLIFLSAAGWATEDTRMRRKAERKEREQSRTARYTQVLTFAVAEGELTAARGREGVLAAVEQSDLRDQAGFQDLRIILSSAATGPSQVLVETTWSGREGLDSYETTRQTLLDVVNAHPEEVVPGSVQVFDMEVVRDTKDTSFKFGLGAAATVLGALLVGGFMLGAGLTAFQDNGGGGGGAAATATPGGNGGGNADAYTQVATDNAFSKTTLAAPPSTKVSFTFQNNGKVKHNLHFYDKQGGTTLADGSGSDTTFVDGGKSETLTFTTPAAGTYYFQCDLHPDQMHGTFDVKEGAPPPPGAGGAPAGGTAAAGGAGAAAGGLAVVATDNKFDKTSLSAAANSKVTVDFKNDGKVMHNLHFYDKQGGKTLADGAGSDSQFVAAGKSETLTFTAPAAGKYYYQCDLHPDQMHGDFTVS